MQEIVRFMKVDTSFMNAQPLRYCVTFDSHPASLPYLTRFHAKKVLKFQDALLTSYHRNEVKYFSSCCWPLVHLEFNHHENLGERKNFLNVNIL